MKYNHGTYQTPKTQVDSDGDPELRIPGIEPRCLPTPDGSDIDRDERKANYQDSSTLCEQFLSLFSDDCCYPVHERDFSFLPKFIAEIELYYNAPNANHSQILKRAAQRLGQAILPHDGSINVIAYHKFNFVLRHILNRLGENPSPGFSDSGGDALPITRLKVLEEQAWYRNFDEISPLSRYLQSCFDFCKERILSNEFGGDAAVPPPFDSLGNGDDDDEANTFRKDVCLFAYLWDAWTSAPSESFAAAGEAAWDQLAVHNLGIAPTAVLHTMSSLILAAAAQPADPPAALVTRPHRWCAQHPPPPAYGHGALFDLARDGVQAVGSWLAWGRPRDLVSEFIREFVWIHDSHDAGFDADDGVAARVQTDARTAAAKYVEQWKLRMSLGLVGPADGRRGGGEDGHADMDAMVDHMDVDIIRADAGMGLAEVGIWGIQEPLADDISIVSEED
ncbi:hypothetical protein F4810DRAFT_697765 [Camillea tinctor]|nr:hypothetical protein F4810DRAFT_697765 [Camillea tinctor]